MEFVRHLEIILEQFLYKFQLTRYFISVARNSKSLHVHRDRIEEFFEMGCELCDFQFTSLEHAKLHYLEEHKISDGYLKCGCGDIKFKTNNSIYDHIEYHLGNNPDRYKYVHFGCTF